jgi:hypothetical protein
VIQELRDAFKYFVKQGKLAAIIYYDWMDVPGSNGQLIRCGDLTEAGKLALSPL